MLTTFLKKNCLLLALVLLFGVSLGVGPAWGETTGKAQQSPMMSQPLPDGQLAQINGKFLAGPIQSVFSAVSGISIIPLFPGLPPIYEVPGIPVFYPISTLPALPAKIEMPALPSLNNFRIPLGSAPAQQGIPSPNP